MKYFIMILLAVTTTVSYAGFVDGSYTVRANTYFDVDLSDIDSDGQWMQLRVILHDDKESLNEGLDSRARAWTKTFIDSKGKRICEINIVRPADWNDKQVMVDAGHELLHCLGGEH